MAKTVEQLATIKGIQDDVNAVCDELGVTSVWIQEWHCRIAGRLDIYTKRHRWHDLKTNERGDIRGWISEWVRRWINKNSVQASETGR